jgi:hypothetical protein
LLIERHHAVFARDPDRHLDASNRGVGGAVDVLGDEARVVHFVDVVAGKDQHVFRRMPTQDIEVLVHRIGGAFVPIGGDALLSRQQLDELAKTPVQEAPPALNVANEALRLVLRADADAPDAGVDAIRQREIDDAKLAAEGYRRLRPPIGQRTQPAPASAGQHDRQRVTRELRHEKALRIMLLRTITERRGSLIDGHGPFTQCGTSCYFDHEW